MKILAIDPGAVDLGWATDSTGRLECGTESFRLKKNETEGMRWWKFDSWLDKMVRESGVGFVVMEEQNNYARRHPGSDKLSFGFTSRILALCEKLGLPCTAINNQKLKAFAIPARPRPKKGEPKNPPLDRSKTAMIWAAKTRLEREMERSNRPFMADAARMRPLSEHEADALWLYWWAKENCA